MEKIVFLIIFLLVPVPLVLTIIIPLYRNHYRVNKDAINYDCMMKKFVFKIEKNKAEILDILSSSSEADTLLCTLDKEQDTINFSEYGSETQYRIDILECDGYSILRLEQTSFLSNAHIMYKINQFMIKKLSAEIIPYTEYGF